MDVDQTRRRMEAMSDDELRRVVTVDVDDWQPDAVAMARQELGRRGIDAVTPTDVGAHRVGRRTPMPKWRVALIVVGLVLIAIRLLFHYFGR